MTATQAVTRTQIKGGRFAYHVNGVQMRTSAKQYEFALVGSGNPYSPDGYYLGLHSKRAGAVKAVEQARSQMADGSAQAAGHNFGDLAVAEITPA